jgi:predicted HAD superfamily Cof-like phosphohydrolase
MGKSNFEKVREFHDKFRLSYDHAPHPRVLDDHQFLFRYDLCEEELHEILKAHRKSDVVALADGLADLLYVTYGMALMCGIPIDDVFAEVHRANMRKERSGGDDDQRSTRGSRFDVIKPVGWQGPDVGRVLKEKVSG